MYSLSVMEPAALDKFIPICESRGENQCLHDYLVRVTCDAKRKETLAGGGRIGQPFRSAASRGRDTMISFLETTRSATLIKSVFEVQTHIFHTPLFSSRMARRPCKSQTTTQVAGSVWALPIQNGNSLSREPQRYSCLRLVAWSVPICRSKILFFLSGALSAPGNCASKPRTWPTVSPEACPRSAISLCKRARISSRALRNRFEALASAARSNQGRDPPSNLHERPQFPSSPFRLRVLGFTRRAGAPKPFADFKMRLLTLAPCVMSIPIPRMHSVVGLSLQRARGPASITLALDPTIRQRATSLQHTNETTTIPRASDTFHLPPSSDLPSRPQQGFDLTARPLWQSCHCPIALLRGRVPRVATPLGAHPECRPLAPAALKTHVKSSHTCGRGGSTCCTE